jgi:hypothetical protein
MDLLVRTPQQVQRQVEPPAPIQPLDPTVVGWLQNWRP